MSACLEGWGRVKQRGREDGVPPSLKVAPSKMSFLTPHSPMTQCARVNCHVRAEQECHEVGAIKGFEVVSCELGCYKRSKAREGLMGLRSEWWH